MKDELIRLIKTKMEPHLSEIQIYELNRNLRVILNDFEVVKIDKNLPVDVSKENQKLLVSFLSAKEIEGCSQKTITYYKNTIVKMLDEVNLKIENIATDDLRKYLSDYKNQSNVSKSTIDNIRRVLSSFFSWLEDEDYIVKNPVRRIHRIKTKNAVKEVLSDENFEVLRDNCNNLRDLAIIELLASTGIRVGELVNLNINDVSFNERECLVLGKGESERIVYFDAKTKIHLQKYLESRDDDNPALFVSLRKPHNRIGIIGVEKRMRKLGRVSNIKKVHPHKFRRTMATKAIDKGMPIEQVQRLLGHVQIDTTMQYAMVNQSNVKIAHKKFIG
ncbi:MAG: tyrosine-type recombinase/integrase [Methanobrevibacter sp.]|uniref:site-specific tyrosine recombinase/integron integrase n=1 Tax=Methanobrevibacter sp. TaxID=66852 RepID=UPI0025CE1FF2|nr:site-specific tyrosine recombinase/integron integrase [Methanobrevibacter sp.]MBQ8018761.1 tyrosine-type recombinase/integrase [Methanobrevibacter sp.]